MQRKSSDKNQSSRSSWSGLLTVSLLVLLVVVLIASAGQYLYAQHAKLEQVRRLQELNTELGLPRDYPIDRVPMYPNADLVECERGNAISTAEEQMDKWYVHAECDEDKDVVYDFYHERMLATGLRQTQYVSIPTGYGSDYADEDYVIEFIIERRPDSERLQIEITVYRVRQ